MIAQFLSFYSKTTLTVCVAFASIPFWVPVAAALTADAELSLMLLIAATSAASGIYAKRIVKSSLFSTESTFASVFSIFFGICIVILLLAYGTSGRETDTAIAALCITLLIMMFFRRLKTSAKWKNTGLYLLIFFLWLGFLNSGGKPYAYCAVSLYFILFFRRFGRFSWK